jgi:asparagine synthase (glutamine-hydrolysing)
MMSQLSDHELEALRPGLVEAATAELDALSPPLATASLADALAFDRAQFLPNLNLAYADVASMAAGIEVRVPLLDEQVAQLALAGSADAMITGGRDKVPLREAARPHVPASILDRNKSGFGGPVRRWFQADHGGVLAERVEAAADAGLVTRTGARRIYAGASSGHHDWALAAWALVCLNAWHDAQEGR